MLKRLPFFTYPVIFIVFLIISTLAARAEDVRSGLSSRWIFDSQRSQNHADSSGPVITKNRSGKWDRSIIELSLDTKSVTITSHIIDDSGVKRKINRDLLLDKRWQPVEDKVTDFLMTSRAFLFQDKYLIVDTERYFFGGKHTVRDIFGLWEDGKLLVIGRTIEVRNFDNPFDAPKEPSSVIKETLYFKKMH